MALHRGHRQATAVSQRHPPAWRVAMSLFTTIPAGVDGPLDDAVANWKKPHTPTPPLWHFRTVFSYLRWPG